MSLRPRLLALFAGIALLPLAHAADLSRAVEIVEAKCFICHGSEGESSSPVFPRLAGQHPDYLLAALKSYTLDGNAHIGRANATMRGMLAQEVDGKKKLTFNNAELKQLAAYLGALPGELKTVPQSKFR